MRIAQLAPLWISVPPATYGGIELMVHLLTEELVRRGHDVTLFATGDSRTSARLRPIRDYSLVQASALGESYEYQYYANASMSAALADADSFDVIHSHLGLSMIPLSLLSSTPVLHTIHTGLSDSSVFSRHPRVPIAAISVAQLAAISVQPSEAIRVIHHGCDFDAYAFSPVHHGYLAFLGRMGPHKSPLDAIHIAKAVGLPLVLAGKPESRLEANYFTEQVEPHIDGKAVSYIGPVNHARKNELLRHASALLFPIQWDEPFGMVMLEAMACGTPVVACKKGSVGEVIDPGLTGYYADSADQLPALIPGAMTLDRRLVRDHATKRFSHIRMVDEYVQFYQSALDGNLQSSEDGNQSLQLGVRRA
jgi:glycosyltransferase involved in cell wall biosynthesis